MENAKTYCENLTTWWGGNWRLPDITELRSIRNLNCVMPSTYSEFDTVVSRDYWSSTVNASNSAGAWYMSLTNANTLWVSKERTKYSICVNATGTVAREWKSPKLIWQGTASWSYDVNHNVWNSYKSEQRFGFVIWEKWPTWVVRDLNTWLFWESQSSSDRITWEDAKVHCENLEKWWKDNWRLPTIVELESLADYSKYSPAINTDYFVVSTLSYWTSTTNINYPNNTWFVSFLNGRTRWSNNTSTNFYLCVAD